MATVILDSWLIQIKGKLGGVVFRRTHDGQLSMAKLPDMSNVRWSKAQKAHRQRFKQAVEYAKAAMADEKVRQIYEEDAVKKKKRPFDLAVSDYFKDRNLLRNQNN